MTITHRIARTTAVALALASLGACSQAGALGSVLGSVLGGGQQGGQQGGGQVSGTVRSVDTRNQQIALQQSNGQTVAIGFDQQTKVVYQNQNYAVTSLENGDQVTARIQQTQNGAYYTDYVQVDASVQSTTGSSNSTSGAVQSLQGSVRRVDVGNGWFEMSTSSNATITVSMPYNAARSDVQRFQGLRNGDVVRFTGVFLNNSRVELRQFY